MGTPRELPAPGPGSEEARTRRALLHMLEDLQRERGALVQARRNWMDTVDAVSDPIMVHDALGRIVRCNRAYLARAGGEFAQVIGRPYWECFPRRRGALAAAPRQRAPECEFALETGEVFAVRTFAIGSGEVAHTLHLFREITDERRALEQSRAVLEVGTYEAIRRGDVEEVARRITEAASRVTGVARANVWLFNEAEDELRCIDHYDAPAGQHASGMVLREAQFENEFRALKHAPYVDASEPLEDPRTAGYVEGYVKPFGITSMLDMVIQVSGKHIGLLCLEHVGRAHRWRPDEIAFAGRLADKMSLTLSNRDARVAAEELRESEERHRLLFESSPDAFLTLRGPAWTVTACNPSAVAMFRCGDPTSLLGVDPSAVSPERQPDGSLSVDSARAMMQIALREGSHCFDWTHRRLDGEEFPAAVLLTRIPLRDEVLLSASVRDVSQLRRAQDTLKEALVATVEAIAATVEMRDPYTAGHQRRVADLAAAIAREMALPQSTVEGIHFGALIHDLGKVQVPTELLSKPAKLSRIEFELIKTHPQAGYEIVKDIAFPWPVAAMVHQHHERFDGSGYPQGLKGEEIALEARIVAVADVVEAMSSHRPYRAGLGIEASLDEIEKFRGVRYDPDAADACLRLFREKRFTLDGT